MIKEGLPTSVLAQKNNLCKVFPKVPCLRGFLRLWKKQPCKQKTLLLEEWFSMEDLH